MELETHRPKIKVVILLAVDVICFIHTTLIIKLNLTFEENRTRKELEKKQYKG